MNFIDSAVERNNQGW